MINELLLGLTTKDVISLRNYLFKTRKKSPSVRQVHLALLNLSNRVQMLRILCLDLV